MKFSVLPGDWHVLDAQRKFVKAKGKLKPPLIPAEGKLGASWWVRPLGDPGGVIHSRGRGP